MTLNSSKCINTNFRCNQHPGRFVLRSNVIIVRQKDCLKIILKANKDYLCWPSIVFYISYLTFVVSIERKKKTLSRTSLHRSCGRWNWLLSHFVIPHVVFKTRMHFQFILLNFALETLRFTIIKLCFFSKAGGDVDTSEAVALAS